MLKNIKIININLIRRITSTIFILSLIGCINIRKSKVGNFNPAQKWPDLNNVHINAHGGGIIKVEGKYYWFGEHKISGKKGNRAQVGVHCYSSENLMDWEDIGIVLKVVEGDTNHLLAKGCILERPKVIYNEKYDNYVMWFHLERLNRGYSSALTGIAESKNVTGPYTFINALRPNANTWPVGYPDSLKNKDYRPYNLRSWSDDWIKAVKKGMFLKRDFAKGQMSRDMTLYIDDDKKAYHIHAAEDNLTLHISELSEDYKSFTGKYYRIQPAGHNEAPAIFKKDGIYFMITSGCTGWKPNAARLLIADSISGKWEYIGNPCKGKGAELTFHSQGTFILPVSDNQFVFMADRWKPENPIEGLYVWLPIQFDENKRPYIEWYNQWNLNNL